MFAIILTMIVLASLVQLGSLNHMISGANIQEWVQGLSWAKTTDTCTTECGTGTTQPTEEKTFKPERIVIESIQMDKKVVSVPLQNGTWAVNDGVGNYAEGTSLVNEKEGNVGIFGHAQANAFLPIKHIKEGETITVYGAKYKAVYRVTKTDIVSPDTVEVFYPTEKASVTLITCDGPQDIHRYMVRGELVSLEEIK